MIRTTGVVILSLSLSALPSYAADGKRDTATAAPADLARTNISHVADIKTNNVIWGTRLVGMAEGDSISALASDSDWSRPPMEIRSAKRPAALPALYVSFAVLQAFDAYSTRQGLARGASETNTLMNGVVGTPAFWALKAATTAGAVVAAEHLWKTNKAGAIAVMIIANGVTAAVAARNASVLKQQR